MFYYYFYFTGEEMSNWGRERFPSTLVAPQWPRFLSSRRSLRV